MKNLNLVRVVVAVFSLLNIGPVVAQICDCDAMVIPVFVEDFSSGEMRANVWDPDIQTHSRIWPDSPEEQYYVNEWHTWLDPQDLTDFSYSSESGGDIVTMKVLDEPVLQGDVPGWTDLLIKTEDTEADDFECADGFDNARDARLRARSFHSLRRFKYGVYTIRTKFPTGPVMWPAFWLFHTNDPNGTKAEIDIVEFESDKPFAVPTNAHIGQPTQSFKQEVGVSVDLTAGFHEISLAWLPVNSTQDFLAWTLDYSTALRNLTVPKVDNTMSVIFNFAIGGSPFSGDYLNPDPSSPYNLDHILDTLDFPLEWEIDEITVHEVFKCGENTYDSYEGLEKDDPVVTGNVLTLGGDNVTAKFIVPGEFSGWHGKHVDAIATKEIIIKNGFHAQSGSTFHARTVPCTGSSQRLSDPNAEPELYAKQIMHRVQNQFYDRSQKSLSSLDNSEQQVDLSIYPNPSKGLFTIAAPNGLQDVQVMDGAGRLIQHLQGGGKTSLQIKNLVAGLYLVTVHTTDGLLTTERVVVQ